MIVIHPLTTALIALIAGILILIFPRLLNIVVALYLIIVGLLGLVDTCTSGLPPLPHLAIMLRGGEVAMDRACNQSTCPVCGGEYHLGWPTFTGALAQVAGAVSGAVDATWRSTSGPRKSRQTPSFFSAVPRPWLCSSSFMAGCSST